MVEPSKHAFTAELLRTSARAYAAHAAEVLLERHPDCASRFAPRPFIGWQEHLYQRLQELAAAIELDSSVLFTSSADWTRIAFEARGVPVEDLRASLISLRDALREDLPEESGAHAARTIGEALKALDRPDTPESGLCAIEHRLAIEYLETVLAGDRRAAIRRVVRAVDEGLDLRETYLSVLLPAQEEIGRMWHLGEISVAEEHFATDTSRSLMAVLSLRAPEPEPLDRTVVAGAVAGNTHDIGLRAVADFLEMDGFRVVCLGADVPTRDLIDAAVGYHADLMVLSAAMCTHFRELEIAIAAARAAMPSRRMPVLVGGRAFLPDPMLWRSVGADDYAPGPEEAVLTARRLLELTD